PGTVAPRVIRLTRLVARRHRAVRPPGRLPPGPRVTGVELRRVRESRGALREIALVSKIGLHFLEYIEEDRYRLPPATVYLRGFLHEDARARGLAPKRVADAYMACMPKEM